MAQQSARRGRKTTEWQSADQARKADMDPVRELPYWPAAMALPIKAGQMTASDYVPTYPELLLASEGASTDIVSERAQERRVSDAAAFAGRRWSAQCEQT